MNISTPLIANMMDLVSFFLVTPQVIGVERIKSFYWRIYRFFRFAFRGKGDDSPYFATPFAMINILVLFTLTILSFCFPNFLPKNTAQLYFACYVCFIFISSVVIIFDRMQNKFPLEKILFALGVFIFISSKILIIQYEYYLVN